MGFHLHITRFVADGSYGKLNEVVCAFPNLLDSLYFIPNQDKMGNRDLSETHPSSMLDKRVSNKSSK